MPFSFTGYFLSDLLNVSSSEQNSGLTGQWDVSATATPSTITISDGRDPNELSGDTGDTPTDPTQLHDGKLINYEVVATFTDQDGNNYTAIVFDYDISGNNRIEGSEQSYFIGFIKNTFDPNNVRASDLETGPIPPAGSTIDFGAYVANTTALNIVCFVSGTLIRTKNGYQKVEKLEVGDLIWTLDDGYQPLRWIGSKNLSPLHLSIAPHLRPIRIRQDAFGEGKPARNLFVSPQHRLMVHPKSKGEALSAAKSLLGFKGISPTSKDTSVKYYHIMFDKHQIVDANGVMAESFYTGEQALKSLSMASLSEIYEIFPDLAKGLEHNHVKSARPILQGNDAKRLIEEHIRTGTPLFEPSPKEKPKSAPRPGSKKRDEPYLN